MQALGIHLLVELHGCHPGLLKKLDLVKEIMIAAAEKCQATVVDAVFHGFSPFGVSGVVVIAESHLAIHTWPEYRYAAVDIFTCGDAIKPEEAAAYIASRLGCKRPSVMEMRRGVIPGSAAKLPHKISEEGEKAAQGVPDAHRELSVVY